MHSRMPLNTKPRVILMLSYSTQKLKALMADRQVNSLQESCAIYQSLSKLSAQCGLGRALYLVACAGGKHEYP